MRDWLYRGEVLHRRLRPAANTFRYPVFFLRFPLSRIDELANAVFSVNSFNLLSFHFADHGDARAPRAWIDALLRAEGLGHIDGEVELQTFPRVLGFVFNPVSLWYCHDSHGRLAAVVAEVNNTFGERHCYLLRNRGGEPIRGGQVLTAAKAFHVSPFCRVEGGYRFRFHEAIRDGATRVVARIDYHDRDGALLLTSLSGSARNHGATNLLAALAAQPFLTLGVVARIHWQAARLWLKGVPFFRKPSLPSRFVTR